LKKSNFSDSISPSESSVRLIIARKSATLIMESSTYLYSQCGLTILELPNEVHSWTLSLLRRLPNQPPSSPACCKNMNIPCQDGDHSYIQSESIITSTSTTSLNQNNKNYLVPLWKPSEATNSTETNHRPPPVKAESCAASDTWHRPSWLLTDLTQR
jgi:hypothetical protein